MSSAVVVDCSLAVKWVLVEPFHQEARLLLRQWESAATDRHVPSLFLSEINTPLLKLHVDGLITVADMKLARAGVLAAVRVRRDTSRLTARALDIAASLGPRTAHDSLHLALAERLDCDMWTADERYYQIARRVFPLCIGLARYRRPRRPEASGGAPVDPFRLVNALENSVNAP